MLTLKVSLRTAAIVLVAFVAYWAALRFGFPGYFSPLIPHHSDLYIPVGLAGVQWSGLLLYPRPLSFVLLRFFGLFGLEGSILLSILPSIALAIAAVFFVQRWAQAKLAWLPIVCYVAILFFHTDFYFEHRHDPHVSLCCILLLVATDYWRKWLFSGRLTDFLISLVVVVVIELLKETYSVSLGVLLVGMVVIEDKLNVRRLVLPILAVAVTGALTMAISFRAVFLLGTQIFGSRKLATPAEAAAAAYRVSFAPADLARGFGFYAGHACNWAAYVMLAIALIAVVRNRRHLQLAVMLALAGFAALVPNSALPNHLFEEYAWDAVPLLFAPILLVPGTWAASIALGVAMCAWVAVTHHRANRSASLLWQVEQEQQNEHLVESLPILRNMDPGAKKILVAGLMTPFNPWVYESFMEHEVGERRWTIVIPADQPESHQRAVADVHAARVQLGQFDYAVCYDGKGNLVKLLDRRALAGSSIGDVLVPGLPALQEPLESSPNDVKVLIDVGKAYLYWGLFDEANVYFQRAATAAAGKNPYPYFYLGQSDEGKNDLLSARAAYQDAVKAANATANPVFQASLDRLLRSGKFNPDGTLAATPAAVVTVSFSASPNPVIVTDGGKLGATSLKWNTSATEFVEIRIDKPNGKLFCAGGGSGGCDTGKWVSDGMTFYLQDASAMDPDAPSATLSTITMHVRR